MSQTYATRAVQVEAMQWQGNNLEALLSWDDRIAQSPYPWDLEFEIDGRLAPCAFGDYFVRSSDGTGLTVVSRQHFESLYEVIGEQEGN